MKRVIAVILLVLACVNLVSARVGSIDDECQANGFDYGIAKWEYKGSDESGHYELESEADGYTTSVTGTDCSSADWTSDPKASGVITKEGQLVFTHPGGTEGTVEQGDKFCISHVTLCGRANGGGGGGGGGHSVPEFSPLTLAVAVTIAGLGIAVLRRK